MEEAIAVRDHNRPCEHGLFWAHWNKVREAKWWQEPDCPGGREMILRKVGEDTWKEVLDP